jgi:hypothetical protein
MLPVSAVQGPLWTTLPPLPTARAFVAAAAAPCPPGQAGTCVYAIGGYDATGTTIGRVEAYNPRTNAWSTLPPLPTARDSLATAAAPCPAGQAGTCVYAIGGYDTVGNFVNTVEAYNPRTNAWSTLTAMTTAREALTAAAAPCPPSQAGTCLYAVGGLDTAGNIAGAVEAYNPTTNAWSTLTSLPTARFWLVGAAAACPPAQVGTCLYAVGGFSSTGTIGTVEAYNPVTNAWSTLAPLPTARGDLAAAAAPCPPGQSGACVYALGGDDSGANIVNTVEAYNPRTNAWSTLPSLPTARDLLAAAAAPCPPGQPGTCVYAVGGYNTAGTTMGTVEALDPPPHRNGS